MNNNNRNNHNGGAGGPMHAAQMFPSPYSSRQQQQPSFFLGAPVTKLVCMFWVVGYFLIVRNSHNGQRHLDLGAGPSALASASLKGGRNGGGGGSPLALFQPDRWVFSSAFELVAGTSFLAQYLRRLERELGPRRFVAWMFYVSGLYALTQALVLMTLGDDAADAYVFDTTVKGPYALIGASTYWYAYYVPRLYPKFVSLFVPSSSAGSSTTSSTQSSSSSNGTNDNDGGNTGSNGGICLSEKVVGYGWSALLLWQKGLMSLLVGGVGMAASAIFFTALPPSLMDVPDVFVKTLPWESLGTLLFLDTTSKIYAPLLVMQTGGIGGGVGVGGVGGRRQGDRPRRQAAATPAAAAAQPQVPNPSAEAIATLTSMGFDEARVKEALQVTNNNVERAADILLAG